MSKYDIARMYNGFNKSDHEAYQSMKFDCVWKIVAPSKDHQVGHSFYSLIWFDSFSCEFNSQTFKWPFQTNAKWIFWPSINGTLPSRILSKSSVDSLPLEWLWEVLSFIFACFWTPNRLKIPKSIWFIQYFYQVRSLNIAFYLRSYYSKWGIKITDCHHN